MIEITLLGILSLFFFQLITEFIAAIYAFGLLGTSIPPEIVAVLLLFSPLILLVFRRRIPRLLFPLSASVMLLSRAVEPLLSTRGSLLVSGLGVAAMMLVLPLVMIRYKPASTLAGLTLGLASAIFLRAAGAGIDLSMMNGFQVIGWFMGLGAVVLVWRIPASAVEDGEAGNFNTILLASLGLTSVWLLLYFTLTAPNVIARWTGVDPLPVLTIIALSLTAFGVVFSLHPNFLASVRSGVLLTWNALFILMLMMTIMGHQMTFPADPAAYPLYESAASLWQQVPLWAMLLSSPVLLLDFLRFQQVIADGHPHPRTLGAAFGLSSLFALLLILAHVFTTTYDYIPVIGPFFRNRFWLVHLVPSMVILLALVGRRNATSNKDMLLLPIGRGFAGLLTVLTMSTLVVGVWRAPRPVVMPNERTSLRVLTYNIQQGYSADGQKSYADQLALMRQVDADIIGLQESDTNRVSGGNNDLVGYFASNLGMYAYYGPKVVPGTFGIALLSRYPLGNARTFYMYSQGEQTAAIHARITMNGRTFNVFVTHLGNDGPIIQQQEFLSEVGGAENAVAMGDFNFPPETEQYRLTTQMLVDAWRLRWPHDIDDQGVRSERPIDHIFLSPGIHAIDVRILYEPASDHPALLAEIE